MDRILVVGGGGVGGYIAHKLSSAHGAVELLSKSLSELYIKESGKVYKSGVKIVKEPKGIYDLVVFATKSYQLEEYAKKLLNHTDKNTKIYPLLNGIEPYRILKEIFKNGTVLKGAVYVISNRKESVIELKSKGAVVVTDEREIEKIFKSSQIGVKFGENIDRAIWQKYLFIAATAALTSYYGADFGTVAKKYINEFKDILKELALVAKKEGVEITQKDLDKAVEILQKSPPSSKTSLQLDLKRGDRSELENLLGYAAKRLPQNSALNGIYSQLLSTQSRRV